MSNTPSNINTVLSKMMAGIGEYPVEYNAKIHGPYNPSVYYGKPDTRFSELKLFELPAWLSRRNYNPRAIAQCVSRAQWKWAMKYMLPRRPGAVPLIQLLAMGSFISYVVQYRAHKNERHAKYH